MDNDRLLKRIQWGNWIFFPLMGLAGWLSWSASVAEAILLGGLLVSLSFTLLERDLTRLLAGPLAAVKARFFLRYYLRFSVLVAILYWLVKYHQVHVPGVLVGLSTVLLSIAAAVAGEAKKAYFTAKEAS